MPLARLIEPGAKVDLREIPTDEKGGMEKAAGQAALAVLTRELAEIEVDLFGARQHALLVVLQGVDTAGKDGAIKKVFADVSPVGCRVVSYKAPTEEELAHDFLWRIHRQVPAKGTIAIFNRSHYEDVVAARVRGVVPAKVWKQRFAQIDDFERLLVESGTIVVKLFLHISKEEQLERLEARMREPGKAWKLEPSDWRDRALWDEFQEAYQESIERCSTEWAPWHVVPADRKWFRNLAVAETLVETLRPYRSGWRETLEKMSRERLAQLEKLREGKEE